jgi:hypothetical protein
MYRLELNVWAGLNVRAGIKYMGWNLIYGLELNIWAGIKYMGWN